MFHSHRLTLINLSVKKCVSDRGFEIVTKSQYSRNSPGDEKSTGEKPEVIFIHGKINTSRFSPVVRQPTDHPMNKTGSRNSPGDEKSTGEMAEVSPFISI